MIRWSESARAGAVVMCALLAAGSARAQQPSARDSAARADSLHRTQPDSVTRDSLVAAQLRAVARRPERSIFHQLHLDRLRLTEFGFSGGVAYPDQIRSTPIYALHADYGEIVPDFRVVFGATYWSSRYTLDAVSNFSQALGRAVGPGGVAGAGDPVQVGDVHSSDVALTAETRWRPRFFGRGRPDALFRPWVALGAGAHFINVQNPTLDGTFVSRALDGVAFGPTAAVGLDLAPVRVLRLTGEARYDLFNGARYGSVRLGGSYVFEPQLAR